MGFCIKWRCVLCCRPSNPGVSRGICPKSFSTRSLTQLVAPSCFSQIPIYFSITWRDPQKNKREVKIIYIYIFIHKYTHTHKHTHTHTHTHTLGKQPLHSTRYCSWCIILVGYFSFLGRRLLLLLLLLPSCKARHIAFGLLRVAQKGELERAADSP